MKNAVEIVGHRNAGTSHFASFDAFVDRLCVNQWSWMLRFMSARPQF